MKTKRTFWDLTPRSPAEVHLRSKGLFCLHLQNLHQRSTDLLHDYVLGFLYDPEDGGSLFFRNSGEIPNFAASRSSQQYFFTLTSLAKRPENQTDKSEERFILFYPHFAALSVSYLTLKLYFLASPINKVHENSIITANKIIKNVAKFSYIPNPRKILAEDQDTAYIT